MGTALNRLSVSLGGKWTKFQPARFLSSPFCSHQSILQQAGQAWWEDNSLPAAQSKDHSYHCPQR